MNSSAAGGFNLFAQAASLSMLQTMQGYAAAAAAGSMRQTGMPGYYLPPAGAMPQLRLHQTAAATGSILNARLLGASQATAPPPPLPPPLSDTRPVLCNASVIRQEAADQQPLQQQHSQKRDVPAPAASLAGELVETSLEGKSIFAFDVGGEKRLCLPQVLNKVLLCAGATLADINRVCEDLNIFCDRCNSQQMSVLKERKVFGPVLESCGLITKSNAERLCKALLNGELPKYNGSVTGEDGIGVYHNCFGKQRGFLVPRLYTNPDAPCIVCNGCSALLSPPQFVGHAHSRPERDTCHWGFDSNNWRFYLLLDKRLIDSAADGCLADSERVCLEKVLDGVKAKFDRKRHHATSNGCPTPSCLDPVVVKRCRTEFAAGGDAAPAAAAPAPSAVHKFVAPLPPSVAAGCAKVAPSQLRQGAASVLLNPESVVVPVPAPLGQKSSCHQGSEHRDYAPNVRLAPAIRTAPSKIESSSANSSASSKVNEQQSGVTPASIEEVIASDWESLTDWGEGHLPEKATPQFLAMVEKVKSGYRSHIDSLKGQMARLRAQVARADQAESEAARLRRQLEEQGSPDVRKLRMKYCAQKEELHQLEEESAKLRLALTVALQQKQIAGKDAADEAEEEAGRSSPPALEMQQQES